MLEDRIRTIEERIRVSPNIPETTRAELLEQLASLEGEMRKISHEFAARSGEPESDAAAGEGGRRPERFEAALQDLTASVGDLEASHPTLAATINRLAITLANMGI